MRANIAVAQSLLVTGYTMLENQARYQELGAAYLDTLNKEQV